MSGINCTKCGNYHPLGPCPSDPYATPIKPLAYEHGTRIDTGDHVHHGPSGEDWVVAYVQGDRLAWCGWPPGEAQLSDCILLRKAMPEERDKLLRQMAEIQVSDPRRSYARYRIGQKATAGAAKALEGS